MDHGHHIGQSEVHDQHEHTESRGELVDEGPIGLVWPSPLVPHDAEEERVADDLGQRKDEQGDELGQVPVVEIVVKETVGVADHCIVRHLYIRRFFPRNDVRPSQEKVFLVSGPLPTDRLIRFLRTGGEVSKENHGAFSGEKPLASSSSSLFGVAHYKESRVFLRKSRISIEKEEEAFGGCVKKWDPLEWKKRKVIGTHFYVSFFVSCLDKGLSMILT